MLKIMLPTDKQKLTLELYEAERRLVMQIEQLSNAAVRRRSKGVTQNIADIRKNVTIYTKALQKLENAK